MKKLSIPQDHAAQSRKALIRSVDKKMHPLAQVALGFALVFAFVAGGAA